MSETPGYEVGDVVDGRRWNGQDWEPIEIGEAPDTGGALPPPTGEPVDAPTVLGTPQPGGPAYGEPATGTMAAGAGPSPFAAAAPLFLLGVLVAVGVSIAGIWVINSRGGGVLWWGGYFVTFGLWRAAYGRYKAATSASGAGLGGLGTAVTAIGLIVALGAAGTFAAAWISDKSAPALTETVGSCWAEDGDKVIVVSCDDADARYTALAEVSNEADCPAVSLGTIETDTPGRLLCLGLK